MKLKNYVYSIATMMLLQTSGALAITIATPTASQVVAQDNLVVEVSGTCQAGVVLKVNAIDSANVSTDLAWSECQSWGYFVQLDISALNDGKVKIKAKQVVNGKTQSATVAVVKNAGAVAVTPGAGGSGSASGIVFGVNGHDGRQYYPTSQSEARFALLNSQNIRSYRIDVDPNNLTVLDQLVVLARKYNITLRPMVYAVDQATGYELAKRYANDIKIWEIGNEEDYDVAGAQDRINAMVDMYNGIKQASDELGADLKTTINIMACNSDDFSAAGRCPGDRNGDMWFLDMAKASGFNFDYISFHYYPYLGDLGYYMDMYLGQMRAVATKYNTKIFYNEMNCGDVYQGNTDGGYAGDQGCYDSIKQMADVLRANYSDIVAEVNMYEMIDEPDMDGAEAHFGLMYDINNPKPSFNLLIEYANK